MTLKTAPRPQAPSRPLTRRVLVTWAVIAVIGVTLAITVPFVLAGTTPPAGRPPLPVAEAPPGGRPVEAAAVPADLPESTTHTTVTGAPRDVGTGATDGRVVHPVRATAVYDAAAGRAIARLTPTQFGDVWLPVIAQKSGWVQVLLPSKPNGSTGWLRAEDTTAARSPYAIAVHLRSKKLELRRGGDLVGAWTVGIGKPSAPTPTGRTFLLGAFRDPKQKYSPVILPLGTHSPTLDSFGGGPGTVAIHAWPTDDVFGKATSEGCIRVSAAALDHLTGAPLGTLVLISDD